MARKRETVTAPFIFRSQYCRFSGDRRWDFTRDPGPPGSVSLRTCATGMSHNQPQFEIEATTAYILTRISGHVDRDTPAECQTGIEASLGTGQDARPWISDITRLESYDPEVRTLIGDLVDTQREQISSVYLITPNSIFRMTASALCMSLGIPLHICESVEQALAAASSPDDGLAPQAA